MPIFEATGSLDPLGLWDTAPPAVSFGLAADNATEASAPVYRVNLPANVEAASSALAKTLDSFERANAALSDIPAQLDRIVRRIQAQPQTTASGASFAVANMAPETGPENELLTLLAYADPAALSGTGPEDIAFGLNEAANQAFGQAQEKFQALLEKVNREILHFAWVETRIADQIIARTEVGWSGNAITVWNAAISAEQISLHQRTLEVVERTRNLTLRLLVTVAGGAAQMAALMAAPGGAVLALPAMYQYVMQTLQQVRQLQSIQAS